MPKNTLKTTKQNDDIDTKQQLISPEITGTYLQNESVFYISSQGLYVYYSYIALFKVPLVLYRLIINKTVLFFSSINLLE